MNIENVDDNELKEIKAYAEEMPMLRLWYVLHILPVMRFSRRRVQGDNRHRGLRKISDQ